MLPQRHRLTKDWQIRKAMRKGRKYYGRGFLVFFLETKLQSPRFAFIASKKVGNAVERNRAIRLMRETVRTQEEVFIGDYVFVATKDILKLKMQDVANGFREVISKIGR